MIEFLVGIVLGKTVFGCREKSLEEICGCYGDWRRCTLQSHRNYLLSD